MGADGLLALTLGVAPRLYLPCALAPLASAAVSAAVMMQQSSV
jgi:hypothetical protein